LKYYHCSIDIESLKILELDYCLLSLTSLLHYGVRKILTDCCEKHVVQKQSNEDDEEDQFSRLTPSLEPFYELCRKPRGIFGNHRRHRVNVLCPTAKMRRRLLFAVQWSSRLLSDVVLCYLLDPSEMR